MGKRKFVHLEIPFTPETKDAAFNFYKGFCEWNLHTDDEFNYTMFDGEGLPGGFIAEEGANKIDSMLLYLESDDLEASLKEVETFGGTVVAPRMEVGDFGVFAIVKDPAGNRLGIWQDLTPQPE